MLHRLRGSASEHERRGQAPQHLHVGEVALVIVPYRSPGQEVRDALEPPWPEWLRELYGLEALEDPNIEVQSNETSLAAAMSAVAARIHHRVQLISWVLAQLAELGWRLRLEDNDIVATRVLTPTSARAELEKAGVLGPMSKVCDLDDQGYPHLWEAGEHG
jgi:hypothetical protein